MSEISIAGIPRVTSIIGQISGSRAATITGRIDSSARIRGSVGDGVYVETSYPRYEGEYQITPSLDIQILATDGKIMEDDVVVLEIPYFETSNPQGGYTAIIGGI